jgi:hypothetical protein
VLLASRCESEIETTPMELDPELKPLAVPIPEPLDELFATTVEFQIVSSSIRELPAAVPAAPIPEPCSVLLASTYEPEIEVNPMELDPPSAPRPAPIPQPYAALLATTVELQIRRRSTLDTAFMEPTPLPIPLPDE